MFLSWQRKWSPLEGNDFEDLLMRSRRLEPYVTGLRGFTGILNVRWELWGQCFDLIRVVTVFIGSPAAELHRL